MPRSLYICYFGVSEPLVQTQVIPYLRELAKDGNEMSLLTFEPRDANAGREVENEALIRESLAAQGIEWHWLRYHKRFSAAATAYDIIRGSLFIRGLIGRKKFDILHGRVHVPALMGAIAIRFSRRSPKLLFDIRGFMPEEYTDAGLWPENGALYKGAKRVEKWVLRASDGFVVLTERAKEILFPEATGSEYDINDRPIEVIPCCVNLERFSGVTEDSRSQIRESLGLGERFVMVYVGSFGGWYMADETAAFYGELKKRRKDAFALVLTQSKPEMIEPLLQNHGYLPGDYWIGRVSPAEVPSYVSAADAAVSFIKPCYSKQASSPTKNAEYLACGVPVIANDGVGDTTEQITVDETGVVINEFNEAAYKRALCRLDELMLDRETLASRCRESAQRRFDLESVGGERYRRLYRRILRRKEQ